MHQHDGNRLIYSRPTTNIWKSIQRLFPLTVRLSPSRAASFGHFHWNCQYQQLLFEILEQASVVPLNLSTTIVIVVVAVMVGRPGGVRPKRVAKTMGMVTM